MKSKIDGESYINNIFMRKSTPYRRSIFAVSLEDSFIGFGEPNWNVGEKPDFFCVLGKANPGNRKNKA